MAFRIFSFEFRFAKPGDFVAKTEKPGPPFSATTFVEVPSQLRRLLRSPRWINENELGFTMICLRSLEKKHFPKRSSSTANRNMFF